MTYIYIKLKAQEFLFLFTLVGVCMGNPTIITSVSTSEQLVVDIYTEYGDIESLKPFELLMGLPSDEFPAVESSFQGIRSANISHANLAASGVEWLQKQYHQGLNLATLQVTPYAGNNQYYSHIKLTITFQGDNRRESRASLTNMNSFRQRILNWDIAKKWVHRPTKKYRIATLNYPDGDWLKFSISKDGIYKITGSDLIAANSDIANKNPNSFMLFTHNTYGRPETQAYNRSIPDNLTEIGVLFRGEEDSILNIEDELIFYGNGASGYNINQSVEYKQNVYFEDNIYWLLIPYNQSLPGKRLQPDQAISSDTNIDFGIAYEHVELDVFNPLRSGLAWAQTSIARGGTYRVPIYLSHTRNNKVANIKLSFIGMEIEKQPVISHKIKVYKESILSKIDSMSWSGTRISTRSYTISHGLVLDGANTFLLKNESSNNLSKPYFDYFDIHYSRTLIYEDEPFTFYTPIDNAAVSFQVTSVNTTPIIWNVTDHATPVNKEISQQNNAYSFQENIPTKDIYRYVVFDRNNCPQIENLEFIGPKSFNTVRNTQTGYEHIIIGPDIFANATQPLVDHRKNSTYISLESVYEEFTGGNKDPMAIRLFLQWTQENWQDIKPLRPLVMLMGDADYDYRNITGKSKIFVPTIEVGMTGTRATDDKLSTMYGSIPELPTGRYPAQTTGHVEDYVNKVIEYETNPVPGLWKQKVTLVADDPARPENKAGEDISTGITHTQNSEALASIVSPLVNVRKIYSVEYPEVSDASSYGVVKPAATEAIFNAVAEGTALISYIGHGSAHQWAQERLLFQDRGDVYALKTGMKLPVWIAGTCSWGHFDDIGSDAFSEELIRQPMDGAIGIITTSRLISVPSNKRYIKKIFREIFQNNQISKEPLGVILQQTKTGGSDGELFHLFGDPAIHISFPSETITIANVDPDTVLTLETGHFTGSQSLSDKGGTGYVEIRDAKNYVTRQYIFRSKEKYISYYLPGKSLFRGKFTFDKNNFEGDFIIPKDISFSSSPVKLNIFIQGENNIEGLGYYSNIFLAGGGNSPDVEGPQITFESSSGRILRTNDHLNQTETLIIRIYDPMGINITNEIGHEISLTNLNTENTEVITQNFIYDANSIRTGTIEVNSDQLDDDIYLSLKAWDNANNPSVNEIRLSKSTQNSLQLFRVYNFPNPFRADTKFTFEITADADVLITIYTLAGRKIAELPEQYFLTGYNFIDWNGLDYYGNQLANGAYLYRIKAKNENSSVSQIGKLAIYK